MAPHLEIGEDVVAAPAAVTMKRMIKYLVDVFPAIDEIWPAPVTRSLKITLPLWFMVMMPYVTEVSRTLTCLDVGLTMKALETVRHMHSISLAWVRPMIQEVLEPQLVWVHGG
jgi:hypothetical protein